MFVARFRSWFLLLLSCGWVAGQEYFNSPLDHFGGITNNQAYLDWFKAKKGSYNASFFLPTSDPNSTNGAAVHWTIRQDQISLAVAVQALGWLGFGLSEVGGMEGADMLLFQANQPNQTVDAYVMEQRMPLTDDCQDWNFVASRVDRGFLIVEVSRALDTGDTQDRKIIRDDNLTVPLHLVIAAWGDSPTVSYHGNRRARGAVRWFQFGRDEYATFRKHMAEAQGSFELRASNHSLAPIETDYVLFCLSWSQIIAQSVPNSTKLTTIGIEPVIDPRAAAFVHHFTVYGGTQTMNGVSCANFDSLTELVYVWAPGEPPLEYPQNVGGSLGGSSYKSLALQIHYNNPKRLSNILDSSGIRIFYTTVPRQYQMGMLQLGDPDITLRGVKVGEGLSQHVFHCPSTCSQRLLSAPITVFREQLHMHQVGASMQNEVIRDGKVVRSARIDFWNFQQQGAPPVIQQPYQIHPGDSFRTVCNYRADANTTFGLASSNEMCIVFIQYYPKIPRDSPWSCARRFFAYALTCRASYEKKALSNEAALDRVFGTRPGTCSSTEPTGSPTSAPCPCKGWQLICRVLNGCPP